MEKPGIIRNISLLFWVQPPSCFRTSVPSICSGKIVIISFIAGGIPKWKMVKGTVAEYHIHPLYPDELKTQSLSLTPNPVFDASCSPPLQSVIPHWVTPKIPFNIKRPMALPGPQVGISISAHHAAVPYALRHRG